MLDQMGRALDTMLMAVAISVAGCGGSDDEGHIQTAAERCQNFVDAYCTKEAECVYPTDRARTYDDCEFVFWVNFDCSAVRGVGPTYGLCLREISQISCASLDPESGLPLPSSCQGVVLK
jgi:hypothetical protein